MSPKANISDLLEVFDRGRVAIVMDGDKFLGLITRTDLLSYLRLHMPKELDRGCGILAEEAVRSPPAQVISWNSLPESQ